MEGGHIGRMKRIKAFQAMNAQAAENTGNTTKKWNTTSMTDDEVGTRNPKLKTALQTQAKLPKSATTGKTGKKTYEGDVSYTEVKRKKGLAGAYGTKEQNKAMEYVNGNPFKKLVMGTDKSTDKSTAKAISGSKGKPDVEPKEGYMWRRIRGKWRQVRAGKKITPDENNKTPSSSYSGHPYDVPM